MPIVFLDFDGVLHPEHCHESKHFSCLPVFESVLSQVPDCKLVIASTWRLQIPVERLREKLGPNVLKADEQSWRSIGRNRCIATHRHPVGSFRLD